MSETVHSQSSTLTDRVGSPPDIDIEELLPSAQAGVAAIRELIDTARIAVASIAENQKLSVAALADSQAKLSEIASVATAATAARTQITDEQGVIATKSDHIEGAQKHADKVRADLDRALTAANQKATEAEGLKSRAQSAADTASELLTAARTTKGAIDTDAASIVAIRDNAKESAAQTKALADRAATVDERIGTYETRLAELEAQSEGQLKAIEGLLPGATSAGLAHAFDERRQTFLKPRKHWQWLFVGALLALVALASTALWHVYSLGTATFDELLLLWLARVPVAGALVWLALYASRESALAKRLEEDYGYKSVIASSFQGFHKQMSEIGAAAAPDSPLAKLCGDTLATIASPPGRIYDKHQLTVTPTAELAETAKTLVDAVRKPKP